MNANPGGRPTYYDLRRVRDRQIALEELFRGALDRHRDLSRAVDTQAETIRAQGERIAALEAVLIYGTRPRGRA